MIANQEQHGDDLMAMPIVKYGARFSADRLYRYHLWRVWAPNLRQCVFVGLNPSTADEIADDPTIRKCVGFARRWGFGGIDMVNLFAWRSTKPAGLLTVADPVGPNNEKTLERVFDRAGRIVWAWGRHSAAVQRLVGGRIAHHGRFYAIPKDCETGTLGRSQDGSPRHPLMLAYTTRFIEGDALV